MPATAATTALDTLRAICAARTEAYATGQVPTASGGVTPIHPVGLSASAGRALRDLVAVERPVRTIETGFGLGLSGLWMLEGAVSGAGLSTYGGHTAIDPGQPAGAYMDAAGLGLWTRAGVRDRLTLIPEPSEIALPRLVSQSARFDFAFIDGAHWFEHVLIDLTMLARLIPAGGLIVVDDVWMGGVRSAADYAARNLNVTPEPAPKGGERFAVLRVTPPDPGRAWDAFTPFEVSQNRRG